jgi:oligoendopeptidase F
MNKTFAPIEKKPRKFLPEDFKVTTWDALQPYFEDLVKRPLDSRAALDRWLADLSELEAVIHEDASWRQINMTRDTTNPELEAAFNYFVLELDPKIKPYAFRLNQKLTECPFTKELDKSVFFPYLRSVANAIELYREENVPLQAELGVFAQQYGVIAGSMTVEIENTEYTLQQAARFLQSPDRGLREEVFGKIAARRMEDIASLDELFDKLLERRHKIAQNAGFANYRDYKFRELGRFDYTPEDCFAFHEAVRAYILPLHRTLVERRAVRLGVDVMRPWDTDAEPPGIAPLQPFQTSEELIEKSIEVFRRLRPYFAGCLETMRTMGRLDLDSRKGKAPGGYNCPLAETGVPFIFMNAAGTMGDMITMMHEGGHAVHSFLAHPLPLNALKDYPMEIAELASMSMELFTMEHWDVFFSDADELRRARLDELERVISVLPWIATIDKFQHWLYTSPGHSRDERKAAWLRIHDEFSTGVVSWEGYEDYRAHLWQKQLHLFEVPFYYIEYGIAQLGAIAMWRQYRENKEQALDNYMQALSLGYTKTLAELYAAAGIRFDFSAGYIEELGGFVRERLEELGL